jgi:hypothetical protein
MAATGSCSCGYLYVRALAHVHLSIMFPSPNCFQSFFFNNFLLFAPGIALASNKLPETKPNEMYYTNETVARLPDQYQLHDFQYNHT